MRKAIKINDGNKKGSLFVPFLIFGATIALISILLVMFVKDTNLEREGEIGEKQINIFKEYQAGEKYLYYVDESVKKSIETATMRAAEDGLRENSIVCDYNGNAIWSCQNMGRSCSPETVSRTPTDEEVEEYFVDLFRGIYNQYITEIEDKIVVRGERTPNIPTEYDKDKLTVESTSDGIELIGKAKDPIVISKYTVRDDLVSKYKVNPSFREDIEVNFVDDKIEIAGKIPGFIGDDKDVIESKLDESWNLENYDTISHSPSCSYDTSEECTYDCNPQRVCELECDDGEGLFCCKYGDDFTYDSCEGSIIEVIEYSDVYATFSIGTGVNFNQYNPTTSEVEEKEVRYNLGISWIEQTGCSQSCNGHDSVDC
jgi:hypothetical protein